MIGRENEVREYRDRPRFFLVLFSCAFLLIVFRLFYLQVFRGDELRRYSEANRLKKEKLFPTRGNIFDRNGKVIVDNRGSFDVVLFSQYYPFTDEVNLRLAKALGMTVAELEKRLEKVNRTSSFYPILLKSDVSKDVVAAIEMDVEGFPGVDVEANIQRRYPHEELAAQLLGYVGEVTTRDVQSDRQLQPGDYIGKMGIERNFDGFLRGVNGVGYVEVDAKGRRRKTEGDRLLGFVAQTEPVPGNHVYLTIDMDLEMAAYHALKVRNYFGTVVALDPRSGEILAMVNNPSYEPELISGREIDPKVWSELRNSKDRPLRNRAIQDIYPPGSTFKLFVAIAAMAEGLITPSTTVQCHGGIQFGKRFTHCWKTHGPVDFLRAIRESCDVYFYNLGLQLGVDTIAKYARLFGFGTRTGLKNFPEQQGLIPDSEWKLKTFKEAWHKGETLSVAIGQGYVSVTPIQLVSGYAAIANGGFVYRPYLVRKIESIAGEAIKEFQPELARKIEIKPEVFEAVKEGLFQVVNESGGTALLSKSSLVPISGKTGTAQVRQFHNIMGRRCETMDLKDRHHGLFVGYAPRENPQIAVVAVAEHACHGPSAAPIVRDVVEAYFRKQMGATDLSRQDESEAIAEEKRRIKATRDDE